MEASKNNSSEEESHLPVSPEKMFKLVLDGIPGRIFWKDRNSVYFGCNQAFADDAGVENASDIRGMTDYQMAWSKEEADFYMKMDAKVMDEGKKELGIVEPQLNAKGENTWLETNKVPLTDEAGEVIGILGFYNDITEKKEAQEKLQQHAKNLEIKNRELEQFAFITSHDLQEPLTAILSLVDHYKENYKGSLDDEQLKIFNYINESSERMRGMISALLDYCRLGAKIQLEKIDSLEICRNILEDFKVEIDESSATIEMEDLPVVTSSEMEFKLLMQNLIGNAIKFKRPGVEPMVHITYCDSNEFWRFTVADNGIGVGREHEEKIFALYKRLHARTEYTGMGIGLSYCRKIVEALGGEIWFEPNQPEGTKFHFTIPK